MNRWHEAKEEAIKGGAHNVTLGSGGSPVDVLAESSWTGLDATGGDRGNESEGMNQEHHHSAKAAGSFILTGVGTGAYRSVQRPSISY